MFSIGEVAKTTGVKVPTIRYYESIGLLSDPGRTSGNQRRYGHAEIDRLTFIRHARDLGFPLDAVRQLIRLSRHPEQSCADADRIAVGQLQAVRARIARLRRLESELERIAGCCSSGTAIGDCRVIEALSDHGKCASEH